MAKKKRNCRTDPAELALPVGHFASGTSESLIRGARLCLGRPFRQPLDLSDVSDPSSLDCSPGLEIWLPGNTSESYIFAMFNGELRVIQSNNQMYSLQLNLDLGTQKCLNTIPSLLEPVPFRVIYENVDAPLVKMALQSLISNAEPQDRVLSTTLKSKNLTIKEHLRRIKNSGGDVETAINEIVDKLFEDDSLLLMIGVGDYIGAAAEPLVTDLRPSLLECDFAATARRVTIIMEDYLGNKLNPNYYLWRLLMNVYRPTSQTYVSLVSEPLLQSNTYTFKHPLLDKLGLRLERPSQGNNVEPPPRIMVQIQMPTIFQPVDALLFPTGRLSIWHGMRWARKNRPDSKVEWGLKNDSTLDFHIRKVEHSASDPNPFVIGNSNFDPTPSSDDKRLVEQIWADWGEVIVDVCKQVQIPSELLVITVAHESHNTPRILRLEPLGSDDLATLSNSSLPSATVAAYNSYTAPKGRSSISVPAQLELEDTLPKRQGDPDLTWNQLLQIVDVVPNRMSPGLTQTLVGKARHRVQWLRGWYSDFVDQFSPHAPAPAHNWFTWLLDGRNAILAAAAYHKYSYAYLKGGMDPIFMSAAYNAGSLVFNSKKASTKIWALVFNSPEYPRQAMRYYNAILDVFARADSITGTGFHTVRFWRTPPSEYSATDDLI
jgi:hypothetical protein